MCGRPLGCKRKMRILTGGSIAIMCSASHEGVPRQVISSSASPSCLRAVAHFNCLPRRSSRHSQGTSLPNLTSGGDDVPTMNHAFGTGRAAGGRHHSIRRRLSRQAEQRRRPLGSMRPGRFTAPGLIRTRQSGHRPQHRALWYPHPGSHTATKRSEAAGQSPPP